MVYIDGLAQYCGNSIANALEWLQSCAKAFICRYTNFFLYSSRSRMLPEPSGRQTSHCQNDSSSRAQSPWIPSLHSSSGRWLMALHSLTHWLLGDVVILNEWWIFYWCIYASLCLNELNHVSEWGPCNALAVEFHWFCTDQLISRLLCAWTEHFMLSLQQRVGFLTTFNTYNMQCLILLMEKDLQFLEIQLKSSSSC